MLWRHGHVIFVDTKVFMYAVGRAHPLRDEARAFLLEHIESAFDG